MFSVMRVFLTQTLPSKSNYLPNRTWTCLYLFTPTFFVSFYTLYSISSSSPTKALKSINHYILPTSAICYTAVFYSFVITLCVSIYYLDSRSKVVDSGSKYSYTLLSILFGTFTTLFPQYSNHDSGNKSKYSD